MLKSFTTEDTESIRGELLCMIDPARLAAMNDAPRD